MATHLYVPGEANCDCEEALLHAPCDDCGAGPGAFQHLDAEPAPSTDISAGDIGDGTERH